MKMISENEKNKRIYKLMIVIIATLTCSILEIGYFIYLYSKNSSNFEWISLFLGLHLGLGIIGIYQIYKIIKSNSLNS